MHTSPALYPHTVIRHSNEQLFCNLGGETVLLSIQQSKYYYLDDIGTYIWELLATPRDVDSLCAILQAEFEVTHEQCVHDVMIFLGELMTDGLVQIVPASQDHEPR